MTMIWLICPWVEDNRTLIQDGGNLDAITMPGSAAPACSTWPEPATGSGAGRPFAAWRGSLVANPAFGALGSFVIMLFIGLYVAIDPGCYRRGLVHVLAPSARLRGEEVLAKAASTLRNWLVAQLMAMTVVGVLTWLGLWAIGVPLAPILGLIAALFAFIPNIGPVIAAVPALLLAIPEGATTALLVVGVYLAVQAFESYLITPLILQERVSLPPALVISVQLLLGVLFGILGLALATPLTALGILLTREIYVADYLAKESRGLGTDTDPTRSRS